MKKRIKSFRLKRKYSRSSIHRAKQYALAAVLNLALLKHYTTQANLSNLNSPEHAALLDYLEHEQDFLSLTDDL